MPGSVISDTDLFMNYNSEKDNRKKYLDNNRNSWVKVAASIIASPDKINTHLQKKVK